jgi:hypothetical protein
MCNLDAPGHSFMTGRLLPEEETMPGRDQDLGANDVKVLDVLGNVAEKAAAAVSHKLHPIRRRPPSSWTSACAS